MCEGQKETEGNKEKSGNKESSWFGAKNWKQKMVWVVAIFVYATLYRRFLSHFPKIVGVGFAAAFGGVVGLLIHAFGDKTRKQKDEVVKVMGDKCKSCGRRIHESERALIVDGELVCSECEQKLPPSESK